MGQTAALQNLDAAIQGQFNGVGLAFVGTYLPPGGDPSTDTISCRGYFDRGTQQMGDFGQVVGPKDAVVLFVADVPSPLKKAVVTLDGISVKLESIEKSDESLQRWLVSHV